MKNAFLAIPLMLAAIAPAHAEEFVVPAQAHVLIGTGFTYGGDKLVSGSTSNNDLRAGKGLMFVTGVDFRVNPQFSLQGTIGYHVDAVKSYYGDYVSFKRIPVEFLGYFHAGNKFRIGGGLRYAASAATNYSNYSYDSKFDSKVGAVLEGEFILSQHWGLKVRAVSEKFTQKDTDYLGHAYTKDVKGDHMGVAVNYYF